MIFKQFRCFTKNGANNPLFVFWFRYIVWAEKQIGFSYSQLKTKIKMKTMHIEIITPEMKGIAQEEQDIKTKLESLQVKRREIEQVQLETAKNKVKDIPSFLGVSSLNDVIQLIREVFDGNIPLDTIVGSGSKLRLTSDQKEMISKRLKKGDKPSDLAQEFEVSLGTIQNIKKDAGLVRSRTPATGLRLSRA